jgi:putative iron-dependent peroxidase
MTAQSGILPPASPHARFLLLRLRDLSLNALKTALQHLEVTRHRLQTQDPDAALATVVGFGPELWQQLQGRQLSGFSALFSALQPIAGKFTMPAPGGDLLLHVRSERPDFCFEICQLFMASLAGKVEVLEECAGFRYMDGRDLTGFIDGTENPQLPEERAEAALIADGEYAGGSFVFAQRYVHHLDKWHRLTVDAQEQVIGRSKLESIELDAERMPENSHVSRNVIEEDGEELAILRHSLPYGDAGSEHGLFFIAYTRDLSIIDRMLARMFGTTEDGSSDRLLNFVTPVGGAYFFAPSESVLHAVVGEG